MHFFILLWKIFLLTQYMYIYKKYYYKNNNNSSYNLLSIFVLFFLYNCCDFIFLLKNCVLFSCIMLINLDGLQIFKKMNDILDNNKNKIVNTVFDGIDKILNSQSYLFDFYDKFYFFLYNDTLNAFIMKKNDDNKMKMEDLKELLRKNISQKFPNIRISFEPIELTEKIMAQGASTPIEVRIAGKNITDINKNILLFI